jgi:integrase
VVHRVLGELSGTHELMARLLYGTVVYYSTLQRPAAAGQRPRLCPRGHRRPRRQRGAGPRLHESGLQKVVRAVGILKRVSCHAFRHSFAAHLLVQGGWLYHVMAVPIGFLGELFPAERTDPIWGLP